MTFLTFGKNKLLFFKKQININALRLINLFNEIYFCPCPVILSIYPV